ncbi:MAG: hypothetical protein AB7I18_07670 [Candidatus Berkiella sp.]
MLQGTDLEKRIDQLIDEIRACIETALTDFEESRDFVRTNAIKRIIDYYIQSLREIRHTINPQKRMELYREKLSPLYEKKQNNLGTLGNDLNGGKLARFTFSEDQKAFLRECVEELEKAQAELNPLIEQRFNEKRQAEERRLQEKTEKLRKEKERVEQQRLSEELVEVRESLVPELPVIAGPIQPVIDRFIDENAHPVMNAQMFQDYVKARLRAARALKGNAQQLDVLEDQIDRLFTNDDFKAFARAKAEKELMVKRATKWLADGHIDQSTFELNCKAAEDAYMVAFDRTYSANIKKVRQVNSLLAYAVNPKKDPRKILREINKKADDLRALEARPIQHNTYHVSNLTVTSSHIPEGWLTKEQQALYKHVHKADPPQDRPYTCPSTIRDKRQVGQANAVRTEIAVNGQTAFVGHRHGSPSVLKINNEADRQYRTLQNVKQTMALAAKEKIAKVGEPLPDPLVLDISSMSLLSPVMQGDLLDGMKQFRQVDDSRNAYWSLHGRTIPLEVANEDGTTRTISVKLNSTFMSIGVNAVRGIGTFGARELVQRVNNRGLDQFFDNFVKDAVKTTDPQLARVAKRLDELETLPSIKAAKVKLHDYDRSALHLAYEKLEYCNRALSDPEHRAMVDKKVIKKERQSALKIIKREEKNLDNIYKELANAREEIYQDRIKDLQNILNELKVMGRAQGGDRYKNNKDFQKMQMFVDAIDIYYNQPQPGLQRFIDVKLKTRERNKVLKKLAKEEDWDKKDQLREQAAALQKEIDNLNKSNYRFQARFAMLANYMGEFIEWFCKSGEDRTGLLNEQIEAFCLFIEKYGYPPKWENTIDHLKYHELMPLVHNGAPNRETNAFNDDCPGLKVSDPDFEIPTVSYYTDKKMSNIVKNSAKVGYGLAERVKQFFGNLFGVPSVPAPVRQAQGSIERIVGERPQVAEPFTSLQGEAKSRKDPKRDRVQSYTPGISVKPPSDGPSTPTHDERKSKKGRRNTSKF